MEQEFNDMKDVFRVLPATQEEKEYMIVIETSSNNRNVSNT